MKQHANIPTLLHSYFTQRLVAERHSSPHTIASNRDTFRLLLVFAQERLGNASRLRLGGAQRQTVTHGLAVVANQQKITREHKVIPGHSVER